VGQLASTHVMNYAEAVTKRVLEAALQGTVLDYRPTQSHGEYDFDLRYSDGTLAAVEATAAIDECLTRTIARIRSKKAGGSVISAVTCKKSWRIFPVSGACIRTIRANADEQLAKLEHEGIDRFFAVSGRSPSVNEVCCKLQIFGSGVISSEGDASIKIAYHSGGGAVGPSTAIKTGETEAWKEDNREKLGRAKTAERHLVVYIGADNGLPWNAITSFEPPSTLPRIPEEITNLWLIGPGGTQDQFTVWSASTTDVWSSTKSSVLQPNRTEHNKLIPTSALPRTASPHQARCAAGARSSLRLRAPARSLRATALRWSRRTCQWESPRPRWSPSPWRAPSSWSRSWHRPPGA